MIHALHGNFGLPSDWDAALPQGVPAKAWHLWEIRRHHPETHTLTGFATWFNNQIEALPPDPSRVLAGYSLGGRLALHVLADRPRLWHRALFLSTHPGIAGEPERAARLGSDITWQEQCRSLPWPEICAAWNAQPVLRGPAPPRDPSALLPWRGEISGAFSGWSLGRQKNILTTFSRLNCSGFWMAGADDSKFCLMAQTACATLPGFGLQIIPGAGHRLLLEQPEAVLSALRLTLH